MYKHFSLTFLIFFLYIINVNQNVLKAQEKQSPQTYRSPTDDANNKNNSLASKKENSKGLDFYVLTIERGYGLGQLWSWWGHTALWVRDKNKQRNLVFDYGLFDGFTPSFLWNYLNSWPVFSLGVNYLRNTLRTYHYERRTVWVQQIFAPEAELSQAYHKLLKNAQPKNKNYHYQHFYNNCTTKIRDITNQLLQDALRKNTKDKLAPESMRTTSIAPSLSWPPIFLLFYAFTGERLGKQVSEWITRCKNMLRR